MRPTDERGRPIGASPGGLPAGGRPASVEAGFDIGLHRPLHKLAFFSLIRREAFFKGFPCVLWSI